jgi:hypothetical protein
MSESAARTSIAYLPIGAGGVYYFGGAIWTSGLGTIPDGDVSLSDDIALLAGLGFVPGGGHGAFQDLDVFPDRTADVQLTLPVPGVAVVALAESDVDGNVLALTAAGLPSPLGATEQVRGDG